MIEFKPFPKIPRLKNASCVITEKIDGTNGVVHVSEDGTITAGSRNRWLTEGHDNYGFRGWVEANTEGLRRLGPGFHYGEWWGVGIQRGYGKFERQFHLFNIGRWLDDEKRPKCCGVVPVLGSGVPLDVLEIQNHLDSLCSNGSVVAPGFMKPEGICVWVPMTQQYFKYTLDGDSK